MTEPLVVVAFNDVADLVVGVFAIAARKTPDPSAKGL
jgi:hypothetical protein